MKKIFTLPLVAFSILVLTGCVDSESIPSDNLYSPVAERNMPAYCKSHIAKEFGIYSGDIYTYPIEYKRGAKIIYGRYSEDSTHLKEFACLFNNNNTYAGIKMEHRNVKNSTCYRE